MPCVRRRGIRPSVYFVDDNFIGNRKAAREMLPHLVEWQKQHGYPMQSCLRGDAQYRQAGGNPDADARGGLCRNIRRH